MIGKIRPQILAAIICLTVIAVVSLWFGATQIAALSAGAIAPVAMKMLETE